MKKQCTSMPEGHRQWGFAPASNYIAKQKFQIKTLYKIIGGFLVQIKCIALL